MKTQFEDSDIQQIAEKVLDTLKPYLAGTGRDRAEDNIMDMEGLCSYLKVTSKWIHERTHLKEIPFIKLSNKQLAYNIYSYQLQLVGKG